MTAVEMWDEYRKQVIHPATVYSSDDLARARQNIERHPWARKVLEQMRSRVAHTLGQDTDFVLAMIPETTPTGSGFTNCPVCEGNAIHGAYDWNPEDPERLACTTCQTVYPNEKYPEDICFRADRHGGGQEITYHGGHSFDFHGFHLRSSWTGQIRARKVSYMAGQAQALATVYALEGDRRCGEMARDILLRFAAVYPNYLVHSAYAEWIDLPPRLVAERINDLPEDEWTIPPNKPDRKLQSGYWNSGRSSAMGMEGGFIGGLAVAYDLVHDLLTEEQRVKVERDLLIEGTVLLLADPAKNNKSVTNLTGAGIVGMAVGDPGLVRSGAEGFWHFVREWYLFDGTTSESPAYGLMTLSGLWRFADALHGYTDPKGYQESDRWDGLDVYGDGDYRAVFRAFYDTMLPNLKYPASADSYVPTDLGTQYAELMAVRFGQPEYRALLGELSDGDPELNGGEYALFHRDPEFSIDSGDRVVLDDVFFPALRMGYARRGEEGRDGTLILDASHWGGHHHRDSLNLTLYMDGHEVLTDLGYLWDRPDKQMTVRTPAHNLVVVDEEEQQTTERLGSLHLFDATPHVKVIDCSSAAYAQAERYRRVCLLVDHGEAGAYVVDVFSVSGGETHDCLYHGPVPGIRSEGIDLSPGDGPAPYDIRNVVTGQSAATWNLAWSMDESVRFRAWAVPGQDEEVIIGDGWGERGWGHFNPPDKKVEVPYVIRRRQGATLSSCFVSVYEVYRDEPTVAEVRGMGDVEDGAAVEVTTRLGSDVVLVGFSCRDRRLQTSPGLLDSDGRVVVVSPSFLYMAEGRTARCDGREVELDAARLEGNVKGIVNENDACYFVVDGLSEPDRLYDRWVLVDDGESTTGHRVLDVDQSGDETRIYTKVNGAGHKIGGGTRWAAPLSAYRPAEGSL